MNQIDGDRARSVEQVRRLVSEGRWDRVADLMGEVWPFSAIAGTVTAGLPDDGRWIHECACPSRAAQPTWSSAPAAGEPTDDPSQQVYYVGIALVEVGLLDGAVAAFTDSALLASAGEDEAREAWALHALGVICGVLRRYECAVAAHRRGAASFGRLGQHYRVAQSHYYLGRIHRQSGFPDQAEAHYQLAVEYAALAGRDEVGAATMIDRAALHVRLGDQRLGEALARRARDISDGIRDRLRRTEAVRVMGLAAHRRGDLATARVRFDEALLAARAHGNRFLLTQVQRDRGVLLRECGECAAATQALNEALQLSCSSGATPQTEEIRSLLEPLRG